MFVSVGALVCNMELQQVMVLYLSIALVLKGLKDPVGWYTGGMSDPARIEQGTVPVLCLLCKARGPRSQSW